MQFGSVPHILLAVLATVKKARISQLLELFPDKNENGIRSTIYSMTVRGFLGKVDHGVYAITNIGRNYLKEEAPQ
jgi:hypothetical protein